MDAHMVAMDCLWADLVAGLRHRRNPQCHVTDAEIMTIALFFGGNYALSTAFLYEQGYMRCVLSPSRFNGWLHRIKALLFTLVAAKRIRSRRCRKHICGNWRAKPLRRAVA